MSTQATKSNSADIVKRHKARLYPNVSNYYAQPIALDHAKGMHVWDVEGNKYLDFFGGILTVVGRATATTRSRARSPTRRRRSATPRRSTRTSAWSRSPSASAT